MADESLGHPNAALLGNAEGDAGHHAVGLGQPVVQQRAQALGSSQPLAHIGDVGAALLGRSHSGVLAGCHARHQLDDVAACRLGGDRRLRHHEQHHQARDRHLELHRSSWKVAEKRYQRMRELAVDVMESVG